MIDNQINGKRELVTIYCPFSRKNKKNGKMYLCNSVCAKVYPPGGGETFCRKCKMTFEYSVGIQNDTKSFVRTK